MTHKWCWEKVSYTVGANPPIIVLLDLCAHFQLLIPQWVKDAEQGRRKVSRSGTAMRESCACAVVIYCVSESVALRDMRSRCCSPPVGARICLFLKAGFRLEITQNDRCRSGWAAQLIRTPCHTSYSCANQRQCAHVKTRTGLLRFLLAKAWLHRAIFRLSGIIATFAMRL